MHKKNSNRSKRWDWHFIQRLHQTIKAKLKTGRISVERKISQLPGFSSHHITSHWIFTARFFCEPPVARRSAYNCFNCSIPGAAMNITYGMNSGLLYRTFNAFGEQSRTHILPIYLITHNHSQVTEIICLWSYWTHPLWWHLELNLNACRNSFRCVRRALRNCVH